MQPVILALRTGTLLVLLAATGCAAMGESGSASLASSSPATGPDWWAANKDRATLVPGKGFTVPGTPGYFDAEGRPIGGDSVQQASYVPPTATDEDGGGLLGDTIKPSAVMDRLKTAVGRGRNEAAAQSLMAEGEALFRQQQYAEAAEKFEAAAGRWPDSPLEHDAMFWKAESLFFADQYPEANDTIMGLVKKYPGTRHLDKVMARQFAIAKYWQEHHMADPHWPVTPNVTDGTRHRFDTLGHALKAYEHIRLSDPTGDLADDAVLATANSYFLRGRYDDADYNYNLLRQEYPKSEHQLKAHLLGLQSKMMKYQGSDYDGTALDEAEKLVTQLLTQFSPQELGDNRERVMKLRAEIAAQQALRTWNRAEYYAKGRHYGAARFYYQQIVKEHPTTKLAMQARERLGSYQGLPDRPTPPVQWLASAFTGDPTEKESEPLPPPPASSRSLASLLFPFASNVKPESPPPVETASTPDSATTLR